LVCCLRCALIVHSQAPFPSSLCVYCA
jgi:hypothetical protein